MEIDFDKGLAALALFWSMGTGVYAWISARASANKKEIKSLSEELESQKQEVTRLKTRLDNMPNSREFNELKVNIVELSGELKAMDEKITPIARTSNRVEQFLIDLGKNKK